MAYTDLVPSWVILWQIALGLERPALAVLPGVLLTALALSLLLKDGPAWADGGAGPPVCKGLRTTRVGLLALHYTMSLPVHP